MPRQLDVRDFSVDNVDPQQIDALQALAAAVGSAIAADVSIVGSDTFTGNPSVLRLEPPPSGPLGDDLATAAAFLADATATQVLGLGAEAFGSSPLSRRTTSTGGSVLHAAQTLVGVRVYGHGVTFRFDPEGQLVVVWSSAVPMAGAPLVDPTVTAGNAVIAAAQHLAANPEPADADGVTFADAPDLTGFTPTVSSEDAAGERATSFDKGPFFDAIDARLQWFWMPGDIRLAWEVRLANPDGARYSILVDAHSGAVLKADLITRKVAAAGDVFLVDGAEPQRTRKPFPRQSTDYPVPNFANPSTSDWVGLDHTEGNLANAVDVDNGVQATGTLQNGVVTFTGFPTEFIEQQELNAFFWACSMHDLAFLLGFNRTNGAFEASSAGVQPVPSDRVEIRIRVGSAGIIAGMDPVNMPGGSPVITLIQFGPNGKHMALDATAVFHEYSHAISEMLVAGGSQRNAFGTQQSEAFNEGTADFFACAITGRDRILAFASQNPNGLASRIHLLNGNFPDTFAQMGTAPYDSDPHSVGAIWCSLMLRTAGNIGREHVLQLALDGQHLPANFNFLQARDAIRVAFGDQLTAGLISAPIHRLRRAAFLDACSHFGLGPAARSRAGSFANFTPDTAPFRSEWIRFGSRSIDPGLIGVIALNAGAAAMSAYNGGELITFSVTDEGHDVSELTRSSWIAGCTSFVQFVLAGVPHILTYVAPTGEVAFGEIAANGSVTQTFNMNWTAGWTSFMGFTIAGHPFHLCYNATNAHVNIDRIEDDGQGAVTKYDDFWTTGWTSFAAFELNGEPCYLAYKIGDGTTDIDRVATDGSSTTNLLSTQLPTGWTDIRSFQLDGAPHFVAVNGLTRDYQIGRIDIDGAGAVSVTIIETGQRPTRRGSFVSFGDDQAARLLAYDVLTGALSTEYYWMP